MLSTQQSAVQLVFFLGLRRGSLYDRNMSLGKRRPDEKQEPIWIGAARLASPAGHPFYERLNGLLSKRGFDAFAESARESFYPKVDRPGLPPEFTRAILVGYFEGIDSARRRIRGERGKRLLRQRVERSFAHLCETGAMRRTHLRRQDNIIKRLPVHAGAFNLGLVIAPRGFQRDLNAFLIFIPLLWKVSVNVIPRQWILSEPHEVTSLKNATPFRMPVLCMHPGAPFLKISSATGC
jgi:hypothetical protein